MGLLKKLLDVVDDYWETKHINKPKKKKTVKTLKKKKLKNTETKLLKNYRKVTGKKA